VRVVPGLSSDMQEQVERGAVDAAILSQPATLGEHLIWYPFVVEQLVMLTSPEVVSKDPLQLLKEMPYIRHTRRAAVGLLADQWLSEHGVAVSASMEMESIESLTSMVSHNLGVSIVHDVCVPDPIFALLQKIPLPAPAKLRVLGVLSRADCGKVRLVDRLLEQLRSTVHRHAIAGRHEAL
jgi:DNA-binding transcriptional LysR family regulator